MSPTSPSDGRDLSIDALVAQGAWVQRLARGLLRDPDAAEDLSQDVIAVALAARPGLAGSRLRSWLRSVAIRIAMRRSERSRARQRAELGASRPEAAERDALDHLRLHRRLAAEIRALPEPYRTALVLRYLDDLPPGVIGQRLDITAAAARKRVSRGLALLRARFDQRPGGRDAWVTALIPVVTGARPALAPTSVLVFVMSSKLVLGGVALAIGIALWFALPRPETRVGPVAAREVAESIVATAVGAAAPEPVATEREAVGGASGPALRVADAAGAVVDGAIAGWIDAKSRLRELELDPDGTALRPASSVGSTFYATAPGYGLTVVIAGAPTEHLTMVLQPAATVRGRIVEDGGVPQHRVGLVVRTDVTALGLGRDEGRLGDELAALGLVPGTRTVWTESDGSFAIGGLNAEWRGRIRLPATHRRIEDLGLPPLEERPVRVAATDGELTIRTTKLPHVFGRLVWADDGTAVTGTLSVIVSKREVRSDMMTNAHIDPDGRFEIGLYVEPRQDPRAAPKLIHHRVRFSVRPAAGACVPIEHTVELEGRAFPVDLGVVRLERARGLRLRVLGADGEPVARAAVRSSITRATTEAEGDVTVAVTPDDELQILAAGYAFEQLSVSGLQVEGREPVAIRLRAGHALRIRLSDAAANLAVEVFPGIAWHRTPFEGATVAGESREPLPSRVHYTFQHAHGSAVEGLSYSHANPGLPGRFGLRRPPAGEVLVPGLRPGSMLSVVLMDALHQPLFEQEIEVPEQPGIHDVELAWQRDAAAHLRVRVVDDSGVPVPGGSILVMGQGRGKGSHLDQDGCAERGPLAPGSYGLTVDADGFMPCEIVHELVTDAPVLELALERARQIEIVVRDSTGAMVAVQKAELRAGTWSEKQGGDLEAGQITFAKVPMRPLELAIGVGTHTWTRALDSTQERADVELPPHGRLLVHVARAPRPSGHSGEIVVDVDPVAGEGRVTLRRGYVKEAATDVELAAALLPGEYTIVVKQTERGSDDANELYRRRVEVRLEAPTRIELR